MGRAQFCTALPRARLSGHTANPSCHAHADHGSSYGHHRLTTGLVTITTIELRRERHMQGVGRGALSDAEAAYAKTTTPRTVDKQYHVTNRGAVQGIPSSKCPLVQKAMRALRHACMHA